MSDMLARATAAASNAWHECETCPGEMYVKEARIVAQAALCAANDPEDEALVDRLGAVIYPMPNSDAKDARAIARAVLETQRRLALYEDGSLKGDGKQDDAG